MNKIDPLFEAMSSIDDNIVSNAIHEKRRCPRGIKAILIAAAVTVFCAISTISAVAMQKAPKDVMINETLIEPSYSSFVDNSGKAWDVYVFDLPDFCLGEEQEGKTAVGKVTVAPNPEYPHKWGEFMIVDETGKEFHVGINNKLVRCESKDGVHHYGFDVLNYRSDEFDYLEFETDPHNIELVIVPAGQGDEVMRQRGYTVS